MNAVRYFIKELTNLIVTKNKKHEDYKLIIVNAINIYNGKEKEVNVEIVIKNVEEVDCMIDNLITIKEMMLRDLMEG